MFVSILKAGTYKVFVPPFVSLQAEMHSVEDGILESRWSEYLIRERADILAEHLSIIETSNEQVAFISIRGKLQKVLLPRKQVLLWKDAQDVMVSIVNIADPLDVPERMLADFESLQAKSSRTLNPFEDLDADGWSGQSGVLEDLLLFDLEREES